MSYYWKQNHGSSLPQHLIAIDTETVNVAKSGAGRERHKLKLGCVLYRRFDNRKRATSKHYTKEYRFDTLEELLWILRDIACKKKTRYYIYTHNANFDYAIINLTWLIKQFPLEVKYYINDKPPVIVETKNGSTTLLWLDSLNIFRLPLAVLAESLGLTPKGELAAAKNDEELYAYCRNDTEILLESLTLWRSFIQEYKLGNYAKTIASQSFNAFRHRFMESKTIVQTSQPEVLALERSTYFGGRTECFRLGRFEGWFASLDVNSMYPYVMRSHSYPVRYLKTHTSFNPFEYTFSGDVKPGMVECTLELTEPVLPKIINNRLCFPIGRFDGVFTWPEIEYVKPYLLDIDFRAVHMYLHEPIFEQWVDELYGLRLDFKQSGNRAYEQLTKLILNSLYGKFGQLTPEWIDLERTDLPEDTELWTECRESGEMLKQRVRLGILQQLVARTETDHSMPLIAAQVTARGRVLLHSLMLAAGSESLFYADTDSLVVDKTGYRNLEPLLHPTELGRLDIQWVSDWLQIDGLKRYSAEGVHRHKGIKKDAKFTGANRVTQSMFRSWDYHLSKGETGFVDILPITKTLSGAYTKGNVEGDKVTPLVLSG